MADLAIEGGQIPERFFATRRTHAGFTPATVTIEGGHITDVDQMGARAATRLDAHGCHVLPGFVDIHIHGAAGHDTMDATPTALAEMARLLARHGVTAFLPTTMTAPRAPTLAALQNVAQALEQPLPAPGVRVPGARVLGAHLEGPYISPDYPGAQSATAIRAPDLAEFSACLDTGTLRLVTLAPEVKGADSLIAAARARGVHVALGHSAADYDQARAAFAQGVNQITHTYNAMAGLHHRAPGALGAALCDDAIYTQLIADMIHVHPAAMNILMRCKGPDKTILISDAIAATGMEPGQYQLGGQAVTVRNGECRLPSGALAGSILTLDVALRNLMTATGLPLSAAWVCTSLAPAQALGMDNRLGRIAPGYLADLVVLDADLAVVATVVGGEIAWLRDAARLSRPN